MEDSLLQFCNKTSFEIPSAYGGLVACCLCLKALLGARLFELQGLWERCLALILAFGLHFASFSSYEFMISPNFLSLVVPPSISCHGAG